MDIASLLQFGLMAIVVLFMLSHITAIVRVIMSWITWCKDIRYLYTLPSPPRRWLSGNALEVSLRTNK